MTDIHDDLLTGLDADQREAVMDPAEQLLIIAGAGSGKTRAFVHRIARMVADGAVPESILALSYTNAAANEVSKRLAQMGIIGVQAMTLHAWCHRRPMREFSSVIGKDGYRILDGDGSDDVLRYDMRLGGVRGPGGACRAHRGKEPARLGLRRAAGRGVQPDPGLPRAARLRRPPGRRAAYPPGEPRGAGAVPQPAQACAHR